MPAQGYEGIYSHLALNFLVVMALNDRVWQGRFQSTSKDKVSKHLDLLGRKIYTYSSLQMRIANQQALLSKQDFLNQPAMAKFDKQLSEASHDEFWMFGGQVFSVICP